MWENGEMGERRGEEGGSRGMRIGWVLRVRRLRRRVFFAFIIDATKAWEISALSDAPARIIVVFHHFGH